MTMRKHAYLIIAHKNVNQIIFLLKTLDYPNNDVYLLIDKKSDIDVEEIPKKMKFAHVFLLKQINIAWGKVSQIEAEMALLEAAVKKEQYSYLHLLTGQDLPIKPQKVIHYFFENNNGIEFIGYAPQRNSNENRVKYYHYFIGRRGKNQPILQNFYYLLDKLSCFVQKMMRIDRRKEFGEIHKGSVYFSITGDLAAWLVSQKDDILKKYRYTFCADELFIQTLVWNSKWKRRVYQNITNERFEDDNSYAMRLIDWKRGNPYIWKNSDYNKIITSNMLFARKFDIIVDEEIITNIYKYVTGENND